MAELLEEIKKLSRKEQLELVDQIYALETGEPETSEREGELLKARAQEAKSNAFPGRPADDVLADLEKE